MFTARKPFQLPVAEFFIRNGVLLEIIIDVGNGSAETVLKQQPRCGGIAVRPHRLIIQLPENLSHIDIVVNLYAQIEIVRRPAAGFLCARCSRFSVTRFLHGFPVNVLVLVQNRGSHRYR